MLIVQPVSAPVAGMLAARCAMCRRFHMTSSQRPTQQRLLSYDLVSDVVSAMQLTDSS